MHIAKLRIRNLRSIESAELEFNHEKHAAEDMSFPNVNVLLGSNGTGKTSVLRAVALAVLGMVMSRGSGFVSDGLVRKTSDKKPSKKLEKAAVDATIQFGPTETPRWLAKYLGTQSLTLSTGIRKIGDNEILGFTCSPRDAAKGLEELLYGKDDSAFFLVGYGATRRVEASARVDESARIKSRQSRYERVASLFEDHLALMPFSYWLPDYSKRNPGRYTQVVNLVNRLLPEACRMQKTTTTTVNGTEHLFEMHGVPLPFRALSDGYKAYLGWIGDMLFHLCMRAESGRKLADMHGVVLVDEIDLHLHPEWQKDVLPTLARELPHIQFIVTTHSPLVVGSLESGNLFRLVASDGVTEAKTFPERVFGRSSDEILLSPYFGLESTRNPQVAQELLRLSQQAVSGNATASLKYLELLSAGMTKSDLDKLSHWTPSRTTTRKKMPT